MSSPSTDPYKILGVSKDAQIPEIRSAHRKLVLKCHPDKVQDPALKAQKQDEFQKVQEAYEILSDENQRQKYDESAAKEARIAELRRQMQNAKVSSSSPRSASTFKYEIRTTERPSSYKSGTSPNARAYASYSRSFDEELGRSPPFEPERTVRREASYPDKSSKREMEREREREREKDRDRDRRRKEESSRRAEKEKRAEKKAREKEREKERRRETEEKSRRHAKPAYVEPWDMDDDEPIPIIRTEKKKSSSSSRKHDKRDRSSHREEVDPSTDSQVYLQEKADFAKAYIGAVRSKRSAAVPHARMQMPAVPTPPPAQSSPFPAPAVDDDVRRSAAKPRRGSSGGQSYRTASRESLDADIMNVSPGRSYRKSASAIPPLSGSPPHLPRTNSVPLTSDYSRPIPIRSHTFNVSYGSGPPRGRGRSNLQPQIEESGSEDEYEQRHHDHDRRRRGSKKNHSPPRDREHVVHAYNINGKGRTSLQQTYTRHLAADDAYAYYGSNPSYSDARRPAMPYRESSFESASTRNYTKYKTSKSYGLDDAVISDHFNQEPQYRESYAYGVA